MSTCGCADVPHVGAGPGAPPVPPFLVLEPDIQIRFQHRGEWLVGVAQLQGHGKPVTVRVRAHLPTIERALLRMLRRSLPPGAAQQVGFFGGLKKAFRKVKKAVKKVAVNKVTKAVYKASRKVMKSPITKVALGAAAVVFPPVGIPAAAAFTAANGVLDQVEKGGAAASSAAKKLRVVDKYSKMPGKLGDKARKLRGVLGTVHRWRKGLKKAAGYHQRRPFRRYVRRMRRPAYRRFARRPPVYA